MWEQVESAELDEMWSFVQNGLVINILDFGWQFHAFGT